MSAPKLNPEFNQITLSAEKISQNVDELKTAADNDFNKKRILAVQSANIWLEQAKGTEIPAMLFGELWFTGELCILFADTNQGKSILAVQIGESISSGRGIPGFKLESKGQPVIYFDFELSMKQFEARYSAEYSNHYRFNSNFHRAELNPNIIIPDGRTFEKELFDSIEHSINQLNARILIIDNLTYLRTETEKAKDALPLMKELKALKAKYNLSVLVLAHTPKRDLCKPITRNDLQGSKMLINFCDSSFAIGESHMDKNLRYIKQIKARNCEMIYDTENVAICQIKKSTNFLHFEFLRFGTEQEHLRQLSTKERKNRIAEAFEMHKKGMSNVQIAKNFDVTEGAIRKWLIKANENEYKAK